MTGRPAREPRGLAEALRARTRSLHTEAERSGVIRDILKGEADRYSYALLLRNLLPAYETMERELERQSHAPALQFLAQPVVYRSSALQSDLKTLCGSDWSKKLILLPSGQKYAHCVASASSLDSARLIGHIYTRYLGDLNGGQILRRLLKRSLGLNASSLAFYAYPSIADLESFKVLYRDAINEAGTKLNSTEGVVREAAVAFQHNIAVSMAVQARAVREGVA